MKNVKKLCNCILSASLVLGSSLSPAFADPEVQNDITINGGSSATIQGYQTETPEGYSVSVTWGSLSFVYDKGTYQPLTGTLTRASNTETYVGVQAGATDGQVSKWYGFDGTNNKVEVTNLSTGNVTLGASVAKSTDETTNNGQEVFTLYFPGTYQDASHNLGTIADTLTEFSVNHDNTGNDALTMYTQNTSTSAISGVNLAAHGRNPETGALTATTSAQQFGFYLNISGAPSAGFSTDSSSLSTIGTITLNFTIPAQQQEP